MGGSGDLNHSQLREEGRETRLLKLGYLGQDHLFFSYNFLSLCIMSPAKLYFIEFKAPVS